LLNINHNYNFIANNPSHNFDNHHIVFDYFENNLFDFSLNNNFIDLNNNSFDLSLGCFLDGCSPSLLPDIRLGNFINCLDKIKEQARC
jgi:hypothetical protein